MHDGVRRFSCNVARPLGTQRNQLPDLLRGWFGPAAGEPGTDFHVRFSPSPDGWWIEPLGARVIPLPLPGRIVAYPDLRAAAGAAGEERSGDVEGVEAALPVRGEPDDQRFAVRAAGDSMDGGRAPIRHGDWVVMRWARGRGLGAVEGRVALVGIGHEEQGMSYHLKRVVRDGGRIELRSDNPAVAPLPADDSATVYALHEQTITPESLAPPEGTAIASNELASAFSLDTAPRPPYQRIDGHLFILLDDGAPIVGPDRIELPELRALPGETAYVLARTASDQPWRYCGAGRYLEDDHRWTLPAIDHATYRALTGSSRASRTPSPERIAEARALVGALLADPGPGATVTARGKSCRLLGPAARGGLRIDGGNRPADAEHSATGFKPRTVSLADLAWALEAHHTFGPLATIDEPHVNRLRYLEGTPKQSTRWIDTGWALVLVAAHRAR